MSKLLCYLKCCCLEQGSSTTSSVEDPRRYVKRYKDGDDHADAGDGDDHADAGNTGYGCLQQAVTYQEPSRAEYEQ